MRRLHDRRQFLAALSLTGAGLMHAPLAAAEEPPETTTTRLPAGSVSPCVAPELILDEFLRAEGFTDIRRVESTLGAGSVFRITLPVKTA